MKVGLCTIAVSKMDWQDAIKFAAKSGYKGVEVWGRGHLPIDSDIAEVKNVKNLADSLNLEIAAYGSYLFIMDDPDIKENFKKALKITYTLGASILRVWSGGPPSKNSTPDTEARLVDIIKTLCRMAADYGVTIAFECHDGYLLDNSEALAKVIKSAGEENLGTYFQPFTRPEREDVYSQAEALAPYVVNVHAQNLYQGNPPHRIKDGSVNYTKILDILTSVGYSGYLEVEFLHDSNLKKAALEEREYLESLINKSG